MYYQTTITLLDQDAEVTLHTSRAGDDVSVEDIEIKGCFDFSGLYVKAGGTFVKLSDIALEKASANMWADGGPAYIVAANAAEARSDEERGC